MTIGTYGPVHCRAHNQRGEPCAAFPIHGGAVCVVHGGRAPQVKLKAEERIRALVDPALDRLTKLVDNESAAVALAAVRDILDRAGYTPRQRMEISVRHEAERLAAELGIDADEVIREAERIASGRTG